MSLPFPLRAAGALAFAALVTAFLTPSAALAEGARLSEIARPAIAANTFNVTDHGAKGDGKAHDGQAIQKAIDAAASSGGGRVMISAGRFLSGPIKLRSRIDLHLEKGATLLMSQNEEDFPVHDGYRENFIEGKEVHDVRISGEGTIDGQGAPWWNAFLKVKGQKDQGPRRPQLIAIQDGDRIELDGITTVDPPNTHCSIRRSRDVTIHNVKMTAPDESPNTDAINLSGVKNAVITKCHISTGDDNVVLLDGGDPDPAHPGVENITIRDCEFGFGHGLSIGSHTTGGIRNVLAENLSFDGTVSGLRMKARHDRGGLVRDITYRNVRMKNVRYPIFITSYYPKPPKTPGDDIPGRDASRVPEWRDILMKDITITDCKNSLVVWALPDSRVTGLTLENVNISAEQGAVVFHADARFENVKIRAAKGPALRTYDARVTGMEGVPFEGEYKPK